MRTRKLSRLLSQTRNTSPRGTKIRPAALCGAWVRSVYGTCPQVFLARAGDDAERAMMRLPRMPAASRWIRMADTVCVRGAASKTAVAGSWRLRLPSIEGLKSPSPMAPWTARDLCRRVDRQRRAGRRRPRAVRCRLDPPASPARVRRRRLDGYGPGDDPANRPDARGEPRRLRRAGRVRAPLGARVP